MMMLLWIIAYPSSRHRPRRIETAAIWIIFNLILIENSIIQDQVVIEEFIRLQIANAGASVGALIIQDQIYIDSDYDTSLKAKRESSLKSYKIEDPDLRFPILDTRNEETARQT